MPRRRHPPDRWTITNTVLADPRTEAPDRAGLREAIERQIDEGGSGGFDIDAVLGEDWTMPDCPAPAMTMDDLDRVIGAEDLMPQETQVRPFGAREYALRAPGMTLELRVTTDPDYYEEHTESVEFWSPGNPLFNAPENLHAPSETTGCSSWRSCSTKARGRRASILSSPPPRIRVVGGDWTDGVTKTISVIHCEILTCRGNGSVRCPVKSEADWGSVI